MDVEKLLRFAVQQGASDLHLQVGAAPMLRLGGEPRFVDGAPLTREETAQAISLLAPKALAAHFDAAVKQGIDFSYVIEGVARFRCSAYSNLGTHAIVIRVIRTTIPSIDEMNLPAVIKDIALSERGLTLLTGTTGSGKSTTLATMIDLINNTLHNKIVTIEDPIEYVHTNKKSM